jgi:uncharacterized protein with HEPN domain
VDCKTTKSYFEAALRQLKIAEFFHNKLRDELESKSCDYSGDKPDIEVQAYFEAAIVSAWSVGEKLKEIFNAKNFRAKDYPKDEKLSYDTLNNHRNNIIHKYTSKTADSGVWQVELKEIGYKPLVDVVDDCITLARCYLAAANDILKDEIINE